MILTDNRDNKFNPFPGLRPFTSSETDFFFGRETESGELAGKLIRNRFVAVTGTAGSGKTSLVICGLFPELSRISPEGKNIWTSIVVRAGRDPFGNLARSITGLFSGESQNGKTAEELKAILTENPDGLSLILKKVQSIQKGKTVLFVDQFEEIFKFGISGEKDPSRAETKAFINLLTKAVIDGDSDFHLVVAIRSDFISSCEHFRDFTDLISSSSYLVSPMNRNGLREAISGPLKVAGVEINGELTEYIINELSECSYPLPLLQNALIRLWIYYIGTNELERQIDFTDFSSVGILKDSISRHADEVYLIFDAEERYVCEKMFRILTVRGHGNNGLRYPLVFKELRLAIPCSEDVLVKVIEEYRNPALSLLSPDISVPLNDDTLIDISNECLINLWQRLNSWVNDESESVRMYTKLSEASSMYQQGKTGLLRQPDLLIALNWRDNNKPNLEWAQKYDPAFERAMVYLRTSEKEYNEAEERKKRQNRLKLYRIRIISTIIGGFAIIAAIATIGTAISKLSSDARRKDAEEQAQLIEIQKKAAEEYASVALRRSVDADSSAIYASRREQKERMLRINAENQIFLSRKETDEARKESELAQHESLIATMNADSAIKFRNETQRLRMISVAKNMSLRSLQSIMQGDLQALLAYQAYIFNTKNNGNRNDGDIYMGLYNLAKLRGSDKISTFDSFTSPVKGIAFLPGKKEIFTSDAEGRILRWDMNNRNGQQSYKILYSDSEIIDVLALSPKADWLACGASDNKIALIGINGNTSNFELKGHSGKIKSLTFSYDGKFLYSAALDGKLLKWDLVTKTSFDLKTGGLIITAVDVSSDNKYVAGITEHGAGFVWDQAVLSEKLSIGVSGRSIRSLRFKPDENRIAVGYDDGIIEIWDISDGKKIVEFQAHSGDVMAIRFNKGNSQMATSGIDGTFKLWNTTDFLSTPVCFTDNGGIVIAFEFSPDGQLVMAGTLGNNASAISRPAYADSFAADGCVYVTRNFTPEEWTAYVGKDIVYEKTCRDDEFKIRIREVR